MNQHSINGDHEERIARVVWAAHILSYLIRNRRSAPLDDDVNDDDEDDDDDDDGDDGEDDDDAKTDKWGNLTESDDSPRFKFLDCIAELLSPSKGWHHVVAAGLRESEDFIHVDVARNDGFGTYQSQRSHAEVDDLHSYLGHLQEFFSSAPEQDIHGDCTISRDVFELLAINFGRERIDYWIERVRGYITGRTSFQKHEKERSPPFQHAVNQWNKLKQVLSHSGTDKAKFREQIVRMTYECVTTINVYELLQINFHDRVGDKVWKALRFIARPISNCRLLMRIAARLPHFRSVKFSPISSGSETKLAPQYLVDVTDAWSQLIPMIPSGLKAQNWRRERATMLSQMDAAVKKLPGFREKFKRDCARSFGTHAEVQLFLHYRHSFFLTPSIDYFGCSKKTCFLCEVFLRATAHPISTRGRHWICYPAWGVPFSGSNEVAATLRELEKTVVIEIEKALKGQSGEVRLDQIPQSTIISDLADMSLEEMLQRDKIKKSVKENQRILQSERRILQVETLDGQASTSKPKHSTTGDIEPYDSCVMCNTLPTKLCARCLNCHYCSHECQRSDWPTHKLLCKKLSSQSPRPSPAHKRAILFPEKTAEPLVIWVLCSRKASSEYEELGILVEYESANVRPHLGSDDPSIGTVYIGRNVKRSRTLGFGPASGISWRKEGGYSIVLSFREAFLKDGSDINRSILKSVATSGTVHHSWSGPIIAMRQTSNEFYEDMTLADFRHVVDYFVTYKSTDVREITNPQHQSRTAGTIHGVKVCCYGETKLHGAEPYVAVEVQEVHPIRNEIAPSGDVSPVSKLLGTPLRLCKFSDIETWIDPPGWDEDLGAESNQDAAFLMVELDPGRKDWGWAPLHWNIDIGNVLVTRQDELDLSVNELKLMCYYMRRKILPMIEDASGSGLVSRTRQEVLNFITRENMEKCRVEMDEG